MEGEEEAPAADREGRGCDDDEEEQEEEEKEKAISGAVSAIAEELREVSLTPCDLTIRAEANEPPPPRRAAAIEELGAIAVVTEDEDDAGEVDDNEVDVDDAGGGGIAGGSVCLCGSRSLSAATCWETIEITVSVAS